MLNAKSSYKKCKLVYVTNDKFYNIECRHYMSYMTKKLLHFFYAKY